MPASTVADAEQDRRVAVVAAGVHDAGVLRCEGQPGLLLDGQRVHVGAHRERRPGPPADEPRHDARARRARHLEVECGELLGDEARRLGLLEGRAPGARAGAGATRRRPGSPHRRADRRSLP